MEMLLTFDISIFVKTTKILTSPTVNFFGMCYIFILRSCMGR